MSGAVPELHARWRMRGVITNRHVLTHLPLIWREFGSACAWKCLIAVILGRQTTFLDMTDRVVSTSRDP